MSDPYMEKMREAFYEEAKEILIKLETSLMELEEQPLDMELINRVFRALHTLKGSGAMFGFDRIASFAHKIESAIDLVRTGKLAVTDELIRIILAARDSLSLMLNEEEEDNETAEQNRIIIGQLEEISGSVLKGQQPPLESAPVEAGRNGSPAGEFLLPVNFRIRFKPDSGIFRRGTNPLSILDELRELGDCHIIAYLKTLPLFAELDSENCYIYWDIILTTGQGENAIRDIFIFVEDESEITIETINDENINGRLGEILLARGDIDEKTLNGILKKQKSLGEILVDQGLTGRSEIQSALAEQTEMKNSQAKREKLQKESSIRVGSDKLDKLVDMVGELVTTQTGLSLKISRSKNTMFQTFAEEIERITEELREISMSLRMIPIGTTFSRYKRLIHDLSRQLGKKIELITEGGETQLDATIIERLAEPLIHLIRNSIDHGIETGDEREKVGKDRTGTVRLSAIHSGASVLIRIRDDGAGLDPVRILEKAVQKGIVPQGTIPSEQKIFKLILAPGFSTAGEVTDLSGRGVGMDVVKKTIEELGGTIDIESKKGIETIITLHIPLTLAIIRGLLVRIGSEHYIIPLAAVEECIEIDMVDADRHRETSRIDLRGDLVPYVNLRKLFLLSDRAPDIVHIVFVKDQNRTTGLLVDEIIGEHQTVVKNLGPVYRNVDGLSGTTIMGDGTVALILDIFKLVRIVEKNRSTLH